MSGCDRNGHSEQSIVSSLSLLTSRGKIFHFIHHLQLGAVILKKPVGFIELMSKKNIFGKHVNFFNVLHSPGH